MTLIPGIKQISQVGNDMYAQGAISIAGIGTTEVSYLADPADTRLLAGRDPVLEEISVGMSGVETDTKYATGAQPLTVTDAMLGNLNYCQVQFSPEQDLNGYDSPWPAGGGANQWDEQWELGTIGLSTGAKVDSAEKIRSADYIPIQPNTTYYYKFPNNWRMCYYDSSKQLLEQGNTYLPNITLTSPAGAYYIMFAVDDTTTYSNNIAVNYPSSVTTYSPYSNLCPISGWQGATVTVTGKNLLKGTAYQYSGTQVRFGGEDVNDWYQLLKAGTYTVSWKYNGTGNPRANFRNRQTGVNTQIGYNNSSFTLAEDTEVGIFAYQSGSLDMADFEWWQLEAGSPVSEYVPYRTPTTSSVTFGQTVYGGTADLVSGIGSKQYAEVDLGSLSWALAGSGRLNANLPTGIKTVNNSTTMNAFCEIYTVTNGQSIANVDMGISMVNSSNLQVNDSRYNNGDPVAFKTAVTGVKLVYELALPNTFTFPGANNITLQEGTNTIWTDTNGTDISVTYVTKK